MKVTQAKVVEIHEGVRAALTNEQITRQRVEAIESLLRRNLWGRILWLLLGR